MILSNILFVLLILFSGQSLFAEETESPAVANDVVATPEPEPTPDEAFEKLVATGQRMDDGSCREVQRFIKKGYCCHRGNYVSCNKFRKWFFNKGNCQNSRGRSQACTQKQKLNFLKYSPATKSSWTKPSAPGTAASPSVKTETPSVGSEVTGTKDGETGDKKAEAASQPMKKKEPSSDQKEKEKKKSKKAKRRNVNKSAAHITRVCKRVLKKWRGRGWRKSRRLCYRGVKKCLQAAGWVPVYLKGGHAKVAGPQLLKYGFKKIKTRNPHKAPPGAVVVYRHPRRWSHPGHIDIKGSDGKWYSDFQQRGPGTSWGRKVIGIYVKQ